MGEKNQMWPGLKFKDKIGLKIKVKINLGQILGLQICLSSVESMSKASVYTSETKWALSKNKKDHQTYPNIAWPLLS